MFNQQNYASCSLFGVMSTVGILQYAHTHEPGVHGSLLQCFGTIWVGSVRTYLHFADPVCEVSFLLLATQMTRRTVCRQVLRRSPTICNYCQ